MKYLLVAVLAGTVALMLTASDVAADSSAKKLAKACKGKTAGTEVTVGGKKVKCPEAKK